MAILVVSFIVAAILIAIAVSQGGSTSAKSGGGRAGGKQAAWIDAASRLKLEFRPGHLPVIAGRVDNFRVHVTTFYRRRKGRKRVFTRVQTFFPEELGLGLKLTSENSLSQVGRALGDVDIEVGDLRFDEQVVVRGDDDDAVLEFLGHRRRTALCEFFKTYPMAIVTDREICLNAPGFVDDAERIVRFVYRQVDLAATMTTGQIPRARKVDTKRAGWRKQATSDSVVTREALVRSAPERSTEGEPNIEFGYLPGEEPAAPPPLPTKGPPPVPSVEPPPLPTTAKGGEKPADDDDWVDLEPCDDDVSDASGLSDSV
ncbi:MAG: hypothetical protein AAF517_22210, partial [Planctomycetota bacterium]